MTRYKNINQKSKTLSVYKTKNHLKHYFKPENINIYIYIYIYVYICIHISMYTYIKTPYIILKLRRGTELKNGLYKPRKKFVSFQQKI